MEPTPVTKQTPDPETAPAPAPARRALDPYFETDEQRDHANQWDVTTVWPEPAAEPKKTKPAVNKQ
jgi:hypothetical protein